MRCIDYTKSNAGPGYYVWIVADDTPATMPTTCEDLVELDNPSAPILPGSILTTTDMTEKYMMGEDNTWKAIGGDV